MKIISAVFAISMLAGFGVGSSARRANRTAVPASPAPLAVPFRQPLLPRGAEPLKKESYQFSGPHKHASLTLYLIHGPDGVETEFLTLREAVEQKKLFVDGCALDNLSSDKTVFIQRGDRVNGHAIGADFIVLPQQHRELRSAGLQECLAQPANDVSAFVKTVKESSDAVGFVLLKNGKVIEDGIYATHELFVKLFSRGQQPAY